jgi:hypothetical protein
MEQFAGRQLHWGNVKTLAIFSKTSQEQEKSKSPEPSGLLQ